MFYISVKEADAYYSRTLYDNPVLEKFSGNFVILEPLVSRICTYPKMFQVCPVSQKEIVTSVFSKNIINYTQITPEDR